MDAGDKGESSRSADEVTNDDRAGLVPGVTSLDPDSLAGSFFLKSLPKNCLVFPPVTGVARSSCSNLAMSPAGASRLARLFTVDGPAVLLPVDVELKPHTLSSFSGEPASLLV